MITTNASDIAKEIEAYAQDVERRLQNMVKGYVTELAVTAVNATPLGDVRVYQALYEDRQRDTGLLPVEGLAQGAWTVVMSPNIPFVQNYGFDSWKEALTEIKGDLSMYKLGDTVYLGNATPYIDLLEEGSSNQAPNGIMQPVMAAFKPDLVRYYQGG